MSCRQSHAQRIGGHQFDQRHFSCDVVRYAGQRGSVVQLFPAGVALIRLVNGDNIITSCEMLESDSTLHADGDDTTVVAVDDDDDDA